jgi:NAD(P) transhydrogenase subunit alpha
MTTQDTLIQQADVLTNKAADLANEIMLFSSKVAAFSANGAGHGSPFITSLTVFMLACFVGYYVVWRVTPALHSPLMGVTNAISSVIIVGALIAAGGGEGSAFAKAMGFFAVLLASINIFGGFIVTQRMLQMFKKKGARV